MNTAIYDSNGIHEISIDSLLNHKRMIYLEGEINDVMAVKVSKELSQLIQEDANEPVKMFINSGGGSIDAGMVIYDIIQSAPMPIKTYCLGRAYSMAAVLFCCGGHGRYLLPHSKVMIHEPLIPYGAGGKTSSVQTIADDLKKTKEEMVEILSKHTGQTKRKLRRITLNDAFFKGEEAVKFGLADKVIGFAEMMEA
ncbi:ATP-dependent Clp protease proteolytic subunit [Anaerovibrio sp.]|uniref:ClpP family protease n=1 Tax=Anaerovibrio sp. TaxID=1872532 RepID=UPI0025BF4E95|nr:ATP-dependent Clp protease proteolytic subunit [Anaerovibrio sp.]MBR2142101.1 ATP-dependent Clp protease proteolytic subunit [Anaerovibrio sp.]